MRGALLVICRGIARLTIALALIGVTRVSAQDTTQSYPWRTSYFPYLTASPNDGVMAMGRVVLFQQSRWDARTSVDRQVAFEGGYSTRDAWLLRARADMPHLADGWRLQAIAQVDREVYTYGEPLVHRAMGSVEITRHVAGPLSLAARGEVVRLSGGDIEGLNNGVLDSSESDARVRLAAVVDLRDREYDTQRGALLQGGILAGSDGGGYHGEYALGAFWIPATSSTVITGHAGYRAIAELSPSSGYLLPGDAFRTVPAWEDEFVAGGGPESNRALVMGELAARKVALASLEVRQHVFVFPGGALSVLAFVDASHASDDLFLALADERVPSGAAQTQVTALQDWTVGAGGGVSLRLLRNAVLTATVGRAEHATRVYVSSGWSW